MPNDDDMEPIRAERQTVRFFDGLEVDGYRMPNGEFRVGITGASLALGYPRNWLFRILNGESRNQMKALQGLGFTEKIVKTVTKTKRGDREAKTIGLRDFNRLISYAVSEAPVLKITPVPFRFALDDNRFWIEVHQEKIIYTFPLQFTLEEVSHFAPIFKSFDIRLDEDGMPIGLANIQYWMEEEFRRLGR